MSLGSKIGKSSRPSHSHLTRVHALSFVFSLFLLLPAPPVLLAALLFQHAGHFLVRDLFCFSCSRSSLGYSSPQNHYTDPSGFLTFYLVKNTTRDMIAQNVDPDEGIVAVTIPANATGQGWMIEAWTSDDAEAGASSPFSVAAASPPKPQGGMPSMAGAIIGGVVVSVIVVALIIFAVFYARRRRQQAAGPVFNLEMRSAPAPSAQHHARSFSSMSSASLDPAKNQSALEMEKMQWEMELEGQFARARAGTPDIPRSASPMTRGASPLRNASPLPLTPQRAVTRHTNY
ncbi:hypothetical protein C8R44DRAFT_763859 [Mycena epipterygia]|nr:hypothetical protein C8R44DRAFT_763859 [Mycena epipterygia]